MAGQQSIKNINAIAVARGSSNPSNTEVLWLKSPSDLQPYEDLHIYDGSNWVLISRNPSQLLSDLKTVDGKGSGLDSDTLQGLTPEELSLQDLSTGQLLFGQDNAVGAAKTASGVVTVTSGGAFVYVANSISHTGLTDIGTNTHAQIDSHISDSAIHVSTAQAAKLSNISVTQAVDLDQMEIDITANTAKISNVTTNLSETSTETKVTVVSSDGTDADLLAASTTRAGVMTKAKFDEVGVNNAKVGLTSGQITILGNTSGTNTGDQDISGIATNTSNIATNVTAIGLNTAKISNVTTNLSEGTSTTTTVDVNSSDGTNATLASASTTRAGVMTKAKFDEVVVNNAKVGLTSGQITILGNTSGTNTGDQDISGIATNTSNIATNVTAIALNTAKVTNATHTGEVTGSGALTIADDIVDEANLKVSNTPTNGYVLTAQSSASGGLTWAEAAGGNNITNSNLTFDGSYYAELNGNSWQIKNSTATARILLDIANGSGTSDGMGYGGAAVDGRHTFYNLTTSGTQPLCNMSFLNGLKLSGGSLQNDYLNFGSAGIVLYKGAHVSYGASINIYPDIILKTRHGSFGVILDTNNYISFKKNGTEHSRVDSSSNWILKGSAVVGSEKISLQDDTLIKGSNNAVGTSGFKVTDINNNSLLDIQNNGQTSWGGNKVINVAHTFYNSGGGSASLARFYESDGTLGINLGTAGRIVTANSGQGTIFSTFSQGGVPHIQLYHSARGNIIDLQSGVSHIDATALTVGGQTGITGAKFTIQNASTNTYQQLFFANVRTTTNGFINSSGSFNADQKGLEGFDTDKNKKFFWNGTAWEKVKGNIESVSVASATTITPNIDNSELEIVSALASALTIAVPTGVSSSFYEGKELTFRIKDNGNAYGLTWNAIFVDYTGALPTTTVAGKTVYIGCKYNAVDTKWDVVAVQVQP